ncbi:hypothetical protein ACFL42_00800 [Candidatus Omnitrophota bacterium]
MKEPRDNNIEQFKTDMDQIIAELKKSYETIARLKQENMELKKEVDGFRKSNE